MLFPISKALAPRIAFAVCILNLQGCASDGGAGELAVMGALAGGMIPGVDSTAVAAVGAVAVGSMFVASMSGNGSPGTTSVPTVPMTTPSAVGAAPKLVNTRSEVSIGAEVETLSPAMAKAFGMSQKSGAVVTSVTEGESHSAAGLRALDVITEVAGQPISGPEDLRVAIQNMRSGYMAPVTVWRDKASKELSVKILSARLVGAVSSTSSPPFSQAQAVTKGPWGSISESGYPQTSLAQWIEKETPEAYQGKSCEYLHIALIRSEQMLATQQDEPVALGASKKKAIDQTLSTRTCPPQSPYLLGRLGAWITEIDTIKAPRLGMPSTGASVGKLVAGGPALVAGVQFADVISAVDGVRVSDDVDALVAINKVPTGSTVVLNVWRKGAYVNFPVVLGPPIETRVADLSRPTK